MEPRAVTPAGIMARELSPPEEKSPPSPADNVPQSSSANQASSESDSPLSALSSWASRGAVQFAHRLVETRESVSSAVDSAWRAAPDVMGSIVGAISGCSSQQETLKVQLNVVSMNKKDGTPFQSAEQIIPQLQRAQQDLAQAGLQLEVVGPQGGKPVRQLTATDIVHTDQPAEVNLDDGYQTLSVDEVQRTATNIESAEEFALVDAVKDDDPLTIDVVFVGDIGSVHERDKYGLKFNGETIFDGLLGSIPAHLGTVLISANFPIPEGNRATVAHEIAHVLMEDGGEHVEDPSNLLGPITGDADTGSYLTVEQIQRMRTRTDWPQPA